MVRRPLTRTRHISPQNQRNPASAPGAALDSHLARWSDSLRSPQPRDS